MYGRHGRSRTTKKGWGSAKRTLYKGVWYASKSEARYARYLDARVKAGEVARWERQVRMKLVVNGEKVCTVVPDFRVHFADGRVELHEVKGHSTPVWKIKMRLLKALHPEIEYVVIPAKATVAM